jgi:hypothetical protein
MVCLKRPGEIPQYSAAASADSSRGVSPAGKALLGFELSSPGRSGARSAPERHLTRCASGLSSSAILTALGSGPVRSVGAERRDIRRITSRAMASTGSLRSRSRSRQRSTTAARRQRQRRHPKPLGHLFERQFTFHRVAAPRPPGAIGSYDARNTGQCWHAGTSHCGTTGQTTPSTPRSTPSLNLLSGLEPACLAGQVNFYGPPLLQAAL